ncbi:MAG: tyrosine-type recombinase/integrase [Candidatus Paralactobacillus gallistercoris]|uniref:Tyrosine-type recombinase/integrase n=1 Tax=Candidatus Paralactobacillus gallistercoris TaxID=2838724 RepID=A0A948TK93_9LACO|nr:tyrosine-type recombinase/integrase [Candidatus Paralactobacillus gallistercoris]
MSEYLAKTHTNRKYKRGQHMKVHETHLQNVAPLKDISQIERLMAELKNNSGKYGLRNETIAIMGICTGMRISDLLSLRVHDIIDGNGNIVEEFRHIDIKTSHTRHNNKAHTIFIIPECQQALAYYLKNRHSRSVWLFSTSSTSNHKHAPLSTNRYYHIIVNAGMRVGIKTIGTHTLRKTFGYWFYKSTGDIIYLQQLFNHSDIAITRRYIGLEEEKMKRLMFDQFSAQNKS